MHFVVWFWIANRFHSRFTSVLNVGSPPSSELLYTAEAHTSFYKDTKVSKIALFRVKKKQSMVPFVRSTVVVEIA